MDGYCERIGPGLWAEPLNALTNLAFLVAAWGAWRRWGADPPARALAAVLALIGVGSLLFHTLATPWAALLDVLPVAAFVLLYTFAAHRRFWGQGVAASLLGAALAIPWTAALALPIARVPVIGASAAYWPIAALIALHGLLLARRGHPAGRGLLAGAALLALSILLRSLDRPLCPLLPLGTHWAWHLLNALMLLRMIELLGRHGAGGGGAGGGGAARLAAAPPGR